MKIYRAKVVENLSFIMLLIFGGVMTFLSQNMVLFGGFVLAAIILLWLAFRQTYITIDGQELFYSYFGFKKRTSISTITRIYRWQRMNWKHPTFMYFFGKDGEGKELKALTINTKHFADKDIVDLVNTLLQSNPQIEIDQSLKDFLAKKPGFRLA